MQGKTADSLINLQLVRVFRSPNLMDMVPWYSLEYEFRNILTTYCKDGSICLDPFLVREPVKYLTLFALFHLSQITFTM